MKQVRAIVAMALAGPAIAAAPASDAIWYDIAADAGGRLGHASLETRDGPAGREIVQTTDMIVQEFDNRSTHIVERTVTRLDRSGRPVAISTRSQTGRSWVRLDARIGEASAEISRQTPSERRAVSVALPPGIRFDEGQALLRDWDMRAVPRLEFFNFNFPAMSVDRVVIEAAPGAAPDAEGRVAALRMRYDGGELRGVARLLLDRQHRVLAVTQPMFGTGITTRLADRETALRGHPPYRALRGVMVRAPFRIPPSAVQGHIRYRFSFRDGIRFTPPQTGEQRITATADSVIVDICATCGPGLAHDGVSLADALRSNVWMQSDHPRLRAIAEPIARLAVSDARKMEMLRRAALPYMTRIDFAGHFSALETLQRGSGDCTEASVLLAALGRAAGIPTKVVNGLAYSRPRYHGVSNAFMPHSWTLAFVDGHWRSFDLALDSFDTTHIALTIGDGDARSVQAALQLASLLQWDSVIEIRPRPAG